MGDGRHLRMSVELGGFRCRAVWFGHGAAADDLRAGGRLDVAYRLSRNEWNGAASVQMLRAGGRAGARGRARGHVRPRRGRTDRPGAAASVVDMRGRGVQIATIARLIAAGERVLVLVADPDRRQRHAGRRRWSRPGSARARSRWPTTPRRPQIAEPERRFGARRRARSAGRPRRRRAPGRARVAHVRPPGLGRGRGRVRPPGARGARAAAAGARGRVWQALRAGEERIPLAPDTVARCRTVLAEVGLDPAAHGAAADRPERVSHLPGGARAGRGLAAVPAVPGRVTAAPGALNYHTTMATVPRSAEAERHDHLLAELLGRVSRRTTRTSTRIRSAPRSTTPATTTPGQLRKSGEPFIHHPARGRRDLRRAEARLRHDHRRAAARHGRGHRGRARRRARRASARTWRCWSTGSPS